MGFIFWFVRLVRDRIGIGVVLSINIMYVKYLVKSKICKC